VPHPTSAQRAHQQLDALARHLHQERERILRLWQESVGLDPEVTTADRISRTQFNDHIPQLLDAYEHRLRAEDPADAKAARGEQREKAGEHGLTRWQQGYDQRETMREWGHLHLCLLRELEHYAVAHRRLGAAVMPTARAVLVRLCAEGVCESATRYSQMQQAEAAARVRDLRRALHELTVLERERGEILREAAHDLRGNVGVISNASAILSNSTIEDATRSQFTAVLTRSVAATRELLNELIDLGRLEAGQERRHVAAFDAAPLLRELCDSMRTLTNQRNLFLKCQGPESLPVQGDAVKVRRIVQNLVLNALKVTQQGGVQVIWEREQPDGRRWAVSIQDTGPGFDGAHAAPLEQALNHATAQSHDAEVRASLAGEEFAAPPGLLESNRAGAAAAPAPAPAPTPTPTPAPTAAAAAAPVAGEGIGLSIVKRLCDLLDARLELQTAPGRGTTFRILFPCEYGAVIQTQGTHP
jgi:signal transduction histidine kinase